MEHFFSGVAALTVTNIGMLLTGLIVIWLAVKEDGSRFFLAFLGFGMILANIPFSPIAAEGSPIAFLLKGGIFFELISLLLLVMFGAASDFSFCLRWPVSLLYSIPAQIGLFAVLPAAAIWGFTLQQAAAIGTLGAVPAPAAIFIATQFAHGFLAPIALVAYLYPLLQPVLRPPLVKLLTNREERCILMPEEKLLRPVSRKAKILFPLGITLLVGLIAPLAVTMIGLLMFGNFLRECLLIRQPDLLLRSRAASWCEGVMGFFIGLTMNAELFFTPQVAGLAGLSLFAVLLDIAGGILFIKFMNHFLSKKINPALGAYGVSFLPASIRTATPAAITDNPQTNIILYACSMRSAAAVVSVVVGGLVLLCV